MFVWLLIDSDVGLILGLSASEVHFIRMPSLEDMSSRDDISPNPFTKFVVFLECFETECSGEMFGHLFDGLTLEFEAHFWSLFDSHFGLISDKSVALKTFVTLESPESQFGFHNILTAFLNSPKLIDSKPSVGE